MLRLSVLLSILWVLCVPSHGSAIPPDAPSVLSSSLWCNPHNVRVLDGLAYVAYPNGLAVFDVTEPSTPLLLGRTYCVGQSGRLEIAWPYALVGGGPGIRIFDVSDPRSPRLAGAYPIDGELIDFALQKNLVYVLCYTMEGRLEVIDFSHPVSPVLLGSCPASGLMIEVAGRYAYLPNYHEGVGVVDVSQPEHPVVAGIWDVHMFFRVRLDGNRAYCEWISGEKKQGLTNEPLRDETGVVIYDITNPLEPVSIGEYQGPEWSRDVYFNDGLAYVVSGSGTALIFDFSDPSTPVIVGRLDMGGGSSADFDFDDGVAYAANGSEGLVTVDVSDPSAPPLLGSYWEAGYPSDIAVDGRAAYISDGTFGLHLVDIQDPLRPEEISRLETAASPQDVLVTGEAVYLGSGDLGLDVVDVGDLEHPELVAHLNLPVSGMAIAEDRAYVVKDDRFTSLDIHDPAHPVVLGGCTVPRWAWEVCVHGGFAYIGNSNVGLLVVDISDPAHPFCRGALDLYDWMFDVVTDGAFVYANLAHYKLGVFDVTNPDAPRFVLEVQLSGGLGHLELIGDRLFADADPGLRVFDVSTPGSPVEVGQSKSQGHSFDIRGSFVYQVGGGSMLVLGPSATAVETDLPLGDGLRILAGNPVGDDAAVRLQLDRSGPLSVAVFNVTGQRVATLHEGMAAAGAHALRWLPGYAPSGVYFVRAESGGRTAVRTLQLVR